MIKKLLRASAAYNNGSCMFYAYTDAIYEM